MSSIEIPRIARFSKISFEQFRKDCILLSTNYYYLSKDGQAAIEEEIQTAYENIQLPKRATEGSAGYDFFSPYPLNIHIGQCTTVLTGLRCEIAPGWVLQCYPRSGQGFKYGIHLANTVGIIDSDYYDAENEGHIMIKLINDSSIGQFYHVEQGKAFCQGIFVPFGITVDDKAENVRIGGFGSTDNRK